jgi:predicted transcriptional regulator
MEHEVPAAELAVLQVLWERGACTTRELTDALYPEGTPSHFCTVQKLLERLEGKGHVRRDRGHWPQRFTARIERKTLIDRSLRAVAEKLCEGSLTPLLTHLLSLDDFTDSEREELRAYLDKLGRKADGGKRS